MSPKVGVSPSEFASQMLVPASQPLLSHSHKSSLSSKLALFLALRRKLDKNNTQLFLSSFPSRGSQEKRPFLDGLFSIQSEGLACNHP